MTSPVNEPDSSEIPEAEIERRRVRATRRLLRGFRSADSYGLVLLMIVVTYVVATQVSVRSATWMVLLQIVTVRLSLHTSLARPRVRKIADALFVIGAVGAIANLFIPDPKD